MHVGLFLSFAHLHRSENASRAGATPASAAPRTRLKRGVRRLQLSHYLAPAPVSFIGISICIYIYTRTHIHIYIYTRIHRHAYLDIHTYTHDVSLSILLFRTRRSTTPFSVHPMHALSVLSAASHKSNDDGYRARIPP